MNAGIIGCCHLTVAACGSLAAPFVDQLIDLGLGLHGSLVEGLAYRGWARAAYSSVGPGRSPKSCTLSRTSHMGDGLSVLRTDAFDIGPPAYGSAAERAA
jgi:hypothetical protein